MKESLLTGTELLGMLRMFQNQILVMVASCEIIKPLNCTLYAGGFNGM